MQIDISGLREVKPKIESARKQVQQAKTIASGMSIPSDFEQAGQLKSIPSRLSIIYTGLASISVVVENSINEFETAERNIEAVVNALGGIYSTRKNNNIEF
mgnify:CR=1 FL=1